MKHGSESHGKVKVVVKADSIEVYTLQNGRLILRHDATQRFIQHNLDVDLVVAPVKYRPAMPTLPRQMNNSFNANVFAGYRLDRFLIRGNDEGIGAARKLTHRSIGVGVFTGVCSLVVTPWTTNNQIGEEYQGFGVSRGIMLLGGVESLTFGVAAGWDRLTDRDKHVWIYQDKPWYGLTIGVNIN